MSREIWKNRYEDLVYQINNYCYTRDLFILRCGNQECPSVYLGHNLKEYFNETYYEDFEKYKWNKCRKCKVNYCDCCSENYFEDIEEQICSKCK